MITLLRLIKFTIGNSRSSELAVLMETEKVRGCGYYTMQKWRFVGMLEIISF